MDAFRRLLADGQHGGPAKVDALLAFSQRTVYVATWTSGGEGYRTLTNSNGQTALPVFTDEATLKELVGALGWGETAYAEVGARAVLRHAVAHNLDFLVVDIGSPHALEIDREEIEPLLTPQARRESSGPFAGVGKLSSSMMRAVKPTPPPGSLPAAQPMAPPQDAPLPDAPRAAEHVAQMESRPPPPAGLVASTADATTGARPQATFGSGSSVTVEPLRHAPSDELLQALADFLRAYPEVEWAAMAGVRRGPAAAVPTVGLRVDVSFRQRVTEIIQGLRAQADAQGASLDVLLLDDPTVMRLARAEGLAFYPWKRR